MADKKKPIEMPSPAADKKKALETAIAQIEKSFGKGSIMRLGENLHERVDVISTGSIALDMALGVGGVPRGRIIEIYGPESSGKTTLALHIIASAQKNGGEAAFIDAEHALDPAYARALGVDIDNLLISQPGTGEDALAIAETLVRSGAVDVVVWTPWPPWCPGARSRGTWASPAWAWWPGSCPRPCGSWPGPSPRPTAWSFSLTSCVRKSA